MTRNDEITLLLLATFIAMFLLGGAYILGADRLAEQEAAIIKKLNAEHRAKTLAPPGQRE